MGYDLELVQVPTPKGLKFPVDKATADTLIGNAQPFGRDPDLHGLLMNLDGTKEGPDGTVDYLGGGLSYARFTLKKKAIHVDNNASPKALLSMYETLRETYPSLLILDLQSGQLHNAESFLAWWSRPL